jgi:hypothetical protein
MGLLELDNYALTNILCMLDTPQDLLRLARACQRLHAAVHRCEECWQQLYQATYPKAPPAQSNTKYRIMFQDRWGAALTDRLALQLLTSPLALGLLLCGWCADRHGGFQTSSLLNSLSVHMPSFRWVRDAKELRLQRKVQRMRLQSDAAQLRQEVAAAQESLRSERRYQQSLEQELRQVQRARLANSQSGQWQLGAVQLYHNRVVQAAPVRVSGRDSVLGCEQACTAPVSTVLQLAAISTLQRCWCMHRHCFHARNCCMHGLCFSAHSLGCIAPTCLIPNSS